MSDRVRIVSDGTAENTTVTIDGEVRDDVTAVEWWISAGGAAVAEITFVDVELDAEGELTVTPDLHTPAAVVAAGDERGLG